MSTFHPFPRLPLELQRQIWRCTAEPRTVEVRIECRGPTQNRLLISSTSVPGPLQCCRVARDELQRLYQRAFFNIGTQKDTEPRTYTFWHGFGFENPPSPSRPPHLSSPESRVNRHHRSNSEPTAIDTRPFDPPEERRPYGVYLIDKLDVTGIYGSSIERRYVWLNFDIDMVDIGTSSLSDFKPIASNIKRLKFERENSNEFWFNTEKRELVDFKNVEEAHVVCADGFEQWAFSMCYVSWPCADEKVLFFDPLEGHVANGLEFEGICRQMLLDRRLELTGVAWHTSDEESDS
ncbi:hypothetical protein AG0111_0g4801 [Alternaria gaisen]|uniref:Uncharacterized protein n=1 Tax=Alternaria gaisen TaxID=167740 RepID=A0ACB6FQB8_9PLEO|nr:hypothetical protein AG0111_0g4801 [Alternaria gaisen]